MNRNRLNCGVSNDSSSDVNSTGNSVDKDCVECTALTVGCERGIAPRLSMGEWRMTIRWTCLLLTVSCLGACASANAQTLPPRNGDAPQLAPNCPPFQPEVSEPALEPAPPDDASELPCPECHPPHLEVGLEYLLWFTRGQRLPPLVTSGSLADLMPASLGQTNTKLLFGGNGGDVTHQDGGRLTLAYGIDDDNTSSVTGSFFGLDRRGVSRGFGSNGGVNTPVIGRPFFNVVNGTEDADPVAIPSVASGRIQIDTPSTLYGGEIDYRYQAWQEQTSRFAMLVGARYLAIDEALNIHETSQDLPGLGVPGNRYLLSENFITHNRFYGGEIGAEYEYRFGQIITEFGGKAAFGVVDQSVRNSAFTSITEPNGIVTSSHDRALYISPNNAGRFTRTQFAVVPEGNVKLGYDLNKYIRFTVGYTFIYLSDAARPADQLNRNVNVQPIGTPSVFTPAAPFPGVRSTDFWVQGLDVGLRFCY
jgi:hypothetical protein